MEGKSLIDWSSPWLEPVRRFGPLLDEADPLAALNRAAREAGLRTSAGLELRFAAGDDAGSTGYERHIAASGRVPTRLNGHDLFNALSWLAFPRTKAALNALHAEALRAAEGAPGRGAAPCARSAGRGPVRDAATLLDESGMLLACADDGLADDLRSMRWDRLFLSGRERFGSKARPLVLGHALLDKLQHPFKSICAQVWILEVGAEALELDAPALRSHVDSIAPALLRARLRSPRDLHPLPVLGIPGWWPANAAPDFYLDPQVFRPGRAERGSAACAAAR